MDQNREYTVARSGSNSDNHDKFCWHCHTKVNIRSICCRCCRSFHKYCLENGMEHRTCPVCVKLDEAQRLNMKGSPNPRLMSMMMKHILSNPKFKMIEYMGCWRFEPNDNKKIINAIDLSEINEKIQSSCYSTLQACFVDFEWLHHNCFVYYSENHKFTATAAKLLNFCTHEFILMNGCANCYEHKHSHPNDWMLRSCEQPHLVVNVDIGQLDFWPANKGFKFWPAKVLSVVNEQNLHIAFFGHHEFAIVETKDCYLYSSQNKNPVNLTSDPRDIAGAIEEIESYIKNVCQKFGVLANTQLESVPLKQPFNLQSVSEYLKMIFPGWNSQDHVQDNKLLDVSSDSLIVKNARSTPYANLNGASTSRFDSAKKSLLIPSNELEDIPGKRYKIDDTNSCVDISIRKDKENLSKCMKTFSGVFDHVFDLNEKLEDKYKALESKHEIELKTLELRNEYMADRIEQLHQDMKIELELMEKSHYLKEATIKQEYNQWMSQMSVECDRKWASKLRMEVDKINNEHARELALLKATMSTEFDRKWTSKLTHDLEKLNKQHSHEMALVKARYENEIADLKMERTRLYMESNDMIDRKNEECARAVDEARKQCKDQLMPLIEEAKGKKYCVACGIGKPLDLFYVCGIECQRRYCEQKFLK